jgi:hypothetical protein
MTRKEAENSCLPTAYEHLLYLLFELERAVGRGGIDWSTADADLIQGRLARIAEKVARESGRGNAAPVH